MCGWAVYIPYSTEPCQMLLEILEVLEVLGRMSVSFQVDCKTVGFFFLKIGFAERQTPMRYFCAKREKNFLLLSLYFFSLSQVSLSVFTLIPDLPFDARARVGLNQSKNTSFLAVYLSREETLVSWKEMLVLRAILKHLFRFSDLTDVGAFTSKLPTTNQSELQVTFGLLYVLQWIYIWY